MQSSFKFDLPLRIRNGTIGISMCMNYLQKDFWQRFLSHPSLALFCSQLTSLQVVECDILKIKTCSLKQVYEMSSQRKKKLVHLFCSFILLAYTQCPMANRTDLHGNFNPIQGWGEEGEKEPSFLILTAKMKKK